MEEGGGGDPNRFSGFQLDVETVETVLRLCPAQNTPLKQGVNDKMRSDNHFVCEMFRLIALLYLGGMISPTISAPCSQNLSTENCDM